MNVQIVGTHEELKELVDYFKEKDYEVRNDFVDEYASIVTYNISKNINVFAKPLSHYRHAGQQITAKDYKRKYLNPLWRALNE